MTATNPLIGKGFKPIRQDGNIFIVELKIGSYLGSLECPANQVDKWLPIQVRVDASNPNSPNAKAVVVAQHLAAKDQNFARAKGASVTITDGTAEFAL